MPETKSQTQQSDELIKEEFRSGLTDDQLISLIESWDSETSTFFEDLKKRITINLEYYKGNQTDVAKIRGKNSKAVENRIFMGTETIVPIVTSRPPDMVCEAPSEDELSQKNANLTQKSLYFHYERTQLKDKSERWVRDLILKRFAVYKIDWNHKEDDLDVKVIDPRRIKFPKYGGNVDALPVILESLELTYKAVSDFFGSSVADELLKNVGTSGDNDEMKKRKHTFNITEVWTDDFVVWKSGKNILKKQNNPWYDFTEGSKKNHFQAPKKPYIIKSLFQTDESLIGETDLVAQVIPIQDNINKRKRQIENLSGKVANPPLLIDSDVMDEETASGITNEEGTILYGKDVAQPGKVRFENPGQVPQYLFSDLITSRAEFDNILGVHSTTRGEKSGQGTLGQDLLIKQADFGRIDLIKRRFDTAVGEIGGWWLQIMRLQYSPERFIRLVDRDGSVQKFDVSAIEDGVKLIVRGGTAVPTDENAIRQESVQLFQLGALDPLTLYEKLKFPNPEETFKRLAEFRSGKAFLDASGTGAKPGESGAPSSENMGQLPGAGTIQESVAQGRKQLKQGI